MTISQLNPVLKAVSRSFYLSIRILPQPMQIPVSIAYLLARAADSIADSSTLSSEERLSYLLSFKELVLNEDKKNIQFLDQLISTIDHKGERELLQNLSVILISYQSLSAFDKTAVKKVVATLVGGMEDDLNFFTDSSEVKALPDRNALENYTYCVAGCVGEFWTTLSIQHTKSLSHWQPDKMVKLGIKFGKALQLTNVLRDIAKDYKIGRCYLPASDLKSYQLDTSMLSEKNNNPKFKPVILDWINHTENYFNSAEEYLLAIPRFNIRLRLAALWPILIGLSTLKLITEKENFLDAESNIKIPRGQVYRILLLSLPAILSNTFLRYWINSVRKNHPA